MERITERMLQRRVDRLNEITGNPLKPWIDRKAQLGNFHISGAYGGVALHQMCTEGGGIHDIFSAGHMPKRELYNRINAYIDGIEYDS